MSLFAVIDERSSRRAEYAALRELSFSSPRCFEVVLADA